MADYAEVQFANGLTARFDGQNWTCEDAQVATRLNEKYTVAALEAQKPYAYFPDVTLSVAQWAARELHGTVTTEPDVNTDPEVKY